MLDELEKLWSVFIAIVVVLCMLGIAVAIVVVCGILAIPVALYQAMTDPFK